MSSDVVFLVAGVALLLAVVLPELLHTWALSPAMVLVGVGMLIGLSPLPSDLLVDPMSDQPAIEHVTEVTVLVALMGVGLAIDRPLRLLQPSSWAAWGATWRLLFLGMPLFIGAAAFLGWWLAALPLAAAVLLGAVLAPTDPVLASDVQVSGPHAGDEDVDEDSELRFTLTSEAGLNDGLAFPFVYAAILLAAAGSADWGLAAEWLGWYVVGKVVVGTLTGVAVGWALARLAFRSRSPALRVAERGESLLAVAALVLSYGVGQVCGGYGFLSVFACAVAFRSAERGHDYHGAMHSAVERLERLLTLLVLLMLGVAMTRGLFDHLDWRGVAIGLAVIFVIRPLSAMLSLVVAGSRSALTRREQWAVSFFGVRGVGALYYLAYASGKTEGLAEGWLWSTVGFTVAASVLVHGTLATPVMKRLESARGSQRPGGVVG